MTDLAWTETCAAPRSLATRGETGVAAIEDPGVIDVCTSVQSSNVESAFREILGVDLPALPWSGAVAEEIRVLWIGERRWRIVGDRARLKSVVDALVERLGAASVFDLTGAFACFRIVGAAADEIIMRVCPLDIRPIAPGTSRGTSFAGVDTLLVREESPNSWLVLTPRSFAAHVEKALIEAVRTPGRLALYQPAEPPPL